MIYLLIDNRGQRIELSEPQATWLAGRSTIVECKRVDHVKSPPFADPAWYTHEPDLSNVVLDYSGKPILKKQSPDEHVGYRSTHLASYQHQTPHDTRTDYYDKSEYIIYHPGTRNGRMISTEDVYERLKEMP